MQRFRRWLRHTLALAAALLPWPVAAWAQPACGIAVDEDGSVFFADTARGPWMIDASGKVSPREGPPYPFLALDPTARFAGARLPKSARADIKHAGRQPTLLFSSDDPIAIGPDEALYFPGMGPGERLQVMRVLPSGEHEVLATLPATTEDGPLERLNGIAAGPDGSVYYTENKAVRKITREGTISTVATSIEVPDCLRPEGIPEKAGPLLRGLDVARDGSLVVAASGCSSVLRVTPQGEVSTLLRAVPPWSPTGVALRGDDVYVLEHANSASSDRRDWLPRVRRLAGDGKISLLAEIQLKQEAQR